MNEVHWLAGVDPEAMLGYLEEHASPRKLRLFACAGVRRQWHRVQQWNAPRQAVITAERFAEGNATEAQLEEARQAAEMVAMDAPYFEQPTYLAAHAATLEVPMEAARNVCEFIRQQVVREAVNGAAFPWEEQQLHNEANGSENRALGELIREVFGNPFRPVVFDPVWMTWGNGSVAAIVRTIDEENCFDDIPYLADALTDAGAPEAVVHHLCGSRAHVRGCWVVDGLLGRN